MDIKTLSLDELLRIDRFEHLSKEDMIYLASRFRRETLHGSQGTAHTINELNKKIQNLLQELQKVKKDLDSSKIENEYYLKKFSKKLSFKERILGKLS